MYCPNCHRLFDENVCPECGALGRHPKEDDYCFLCRIEAMWAQMLTDVLGQNDIPSLAVSAEGAAMRAFLGTALGQDDVYVPFASLDEAEALKEALFSSEAVPDEDDGSGE